MLSDLQRKNWSSASVGLRNIASNLSHQNRKAKALHVSVLTLDLTEIGGDQEDRFMSRISLFYDQSQLGQWSDADATWRLLDPMGRDWARGVYRPGDAEYYFAKHQHWHGTLQEEHLFAAERLAAKGKNRATVRSLHGLRGDWRLEQGDWALAA